MKPPPFAYECPSDVAEAVELLASHDGEARPLAGGQSLVPLLNFRLARPAVLVDLNRIEALARITVEDGALRLGAMARQASVETDARVARGWPLLTEAIGHIAHPPDSQPRYCRRQPRPQRSGGRAAGGDAGARCRNDRSGPTGTAHHRGRRLLRRDDGDGARTRRAAHRDQGSGAARGDRLGLSGGRAPPGGFRARGGRGPATA